MNQKIMGKTRTFNVKPSINKLCSSIDVTDYKNYYVINGPTLIAEKLHFLKI